MFDHPATQSLLLPLLLSLAATWVLRSTGRAWPGPAVVVGLLGAWSLVPGWAWPPAALPQQLPWAVLVAGLAGVGWRMARAAPASDGAPVTLPAALAATLLGLALLAALGGSLLLAQMALAAAAALAVPALWTWLSPASGPAWTPADLAAPLVAAAGLALAAPAGVPVPLGLLAWAALVAWLVPRLGWMRRHPRLAPLVVALLVLAGAGVALGIQLLGAAPAPDADDPYFAPRWD